MSFLSAAGSAILSTENDMLTEAKALNRDPHPHRLQSTNDGRSERQTDRQTDRHRERYRQTDTERDAQRDISRNEENK
jgi:hypothetical protein